MWRLSSLETDYFLALVDLERAGTEVLKASLRDRLKRLKSQAENLYERYGHPQQIELTSQMTYCSTWINSAVHILLTIPGLRTVQAIADRLDLQPHQVEQDLRNLESLGLAERQGNEWRPTKGNIHLSRESPMITLHHQNWRQRAISDSQLSRESSIHYTAVHSLSKTDFEKIKEIILQAADTSRKIVDKSVEEDLACIAIDWFWV